jgi:hypothetical protein
MQFTPAFSALQMFVKDAKIRDALQIIIIN